MDFNSTGFQSEATSRPPHPCSIRKGEGVPLQRYIHIVIPRFAETALPHYFLPSYSPAESMYWKAAPPRLPTKHARFQCRSLAIRMISSASDL